MPLTDSAPILAEDHIEDPMQAILDAPMPPGKARDLRPRPRVAHQVVVAGTGPLSAYLPLPVHHHHRGHVRPIGRQSRRVVDDRHVPLLVPPVALLDLRMPVGPDPLEVGLTRPV